jgi:hypothetical protein
MGNLYVKSTAPASELALPNLLNRSKQGRIYFVISHLVVNFLLLISLKRTMAAIKMTRYRLILSLGNILLSKSRNQ